MEDKTRGQLVERFEVLLPHLNERQQRLALGTEARLLGHGGVRAVAEAAGVSATTVRRGMGELGSSSEALPVGRARRAGGGRKRANTQDPDLVTALLRLVEPDERGDPMSPLRWTTKSLRHLADELTRQRHPVSAPTVGRLLRENGFSLQSTAKALEGEQHPNRDAQFGYINEQVKAYQNAGEPVISVDAKKKEQLGQLPAAGQEWHPKHTPIRVEDHSFFTAGPEVPVAVPYGVYDLTADSGWVNVGVDHDTSAFAVASIRGWWRARGVLDYPRARSLLITADAGGSNNYRYRLWKAELAAFAAEANLVITVCHFPPGTSKWNKIEHRLFSHITMNWRGRPLTSHEVVVATIASTRTRSGLRVQAELDTRNYPLGISVTREQLRRLPIQAHVVRGDWNYTIMPATSTDGDQVVALRMEDRARAREQALTRLTDPRLTGMSVDNLNALATELAPAQAAQTAQRRYEQRGGQRRHAPGAGGRGLLADADRVLITIVYQRQICSQTVLSELLGVNTNSIGQAIAETRQLLVERGHKIQPTTLRFTTAAALIAFVSSGGEPDPRSQLPERLADPTLTGVSRTELAELTEKVGHILEARSERHRHRRRGGERLPGARGGVFREKITNSERVLATVLYQRNLCNQDVLADLFQVSRSTIGNAIREVGPLLAQSGYIPSPTTERFATATALLDSVSKYDGYSFLPT